MKKKTGFVQKPDSSNPISLKPTVWMIIATGVNKVSDLGWRFVGIEAPHVALLRRGLPDMPQHTHKVLRVIAGVHGIGDVPALAERQVPHVGPVL